MKLFRNILTVGLILFGLGSCGYIIAKPMANSYVKKNKTYLLPADFFSHPHTLVVILDDKNTAYNKRVQKTVSRLYDGDTEFMTLSEYDSRKDSTGTFKYSFRYSGPSMIPNQPYKASQNDIKGRVFYMYDRSAGKSYKCGLHSSFYMRIVEAYFKRLDKWRLEN